ncbi:MBL fold metallo-hydrolase [Alicyclobacillus tolerans]|uniref:Glyoxylase-like metal-dependent hydrolase (Beta-lactamase superfamily II) n=1 Tax=Alicyclobacillus tolerans TaxID=90970 RepID=A0ABT9LWT5_9BACL|nr:MBL fold metallo-hydrolase [Alicyclobacillus tengchongensis]MDP9728712.1 glyoxylase-like metal-dependent hydrolase (beta-lactamase superfamily II) [Alicyclobacillus tengchongensis]
MATVQSSQALEVHCLPVPTGFAVGDMNAYLLQRADVYVLVDNGPRRQESLTALEKGLREHGISSFSELSALVLTHGHVDHVGLTRKIAEAGVPVYAHPGVSSWLDGWEGGHIYRTRFYEALYQRCGMPQNYQEMAQKEFFLLQKLNDRSVVNVPVHDGMTFEWLPEFQFIEVPGHAQAAIALYHPEEEMMIIGDQLIARISSNALVEPLPGEADGFLAKRSKSLLDYRNNLKCIQGMKLRTVYPGHGNVIDNPRDLIVKRLEEQESRRDKVLQMVRTKPMQTAWDYAAAYFPHRLDQPSLILSEILGYLDWLVVDGEIHIVEKQGVEYFYCSRT